MATYTEIFGLRNNSDLMNKIVVAVAVKAQSLMTTGSVPTTAQITWANEAITNPVSKAESLFTYVLAANKSATTSQILSATDEVIQQQIDTAVDILISGGV